MTTPWRVIQQSLINQGVMTEQGVTRTPRQRHCSGCGRVVVAAITDLGFEVAVDPLPLTIEGELDALVAGRETYALLDHGELVWRNHHRITFRSADEEQAHALHECDRSQQPEVNEKFLPKKKAETRDAESIPY